MLDKLKEVVFGKNNSENEDIVVAVKYLEAIGGEKNIEEIDSCTTRLRLKVLDEYIINDEEIISLGAKAVLKPSEKKVQIVMDNPNEMENALKALINSKNDLTEAVKYLEAIGGFENIEEIDSCMTRLRFKVLDNDVVNEEEIMKLGAKAVLKPSDKILQVVMDNPQDMEYKLKKLK